jgi:AmmeMemoRadiSam system protein B/AmmeMemoRadiSam system protein A
MKIYNLRKSIPILSIIILTSWGLSRGDDMPDQAYVRPPAVAGMFYPGSPTELAKMIAEQFHAAPKPSIGGKPIAIICPHAGYVYSGGIAARGYKILEGEEFKTVIIISPSHMVAFRGISAFAGKAYSTPFGQVPIDEDLTQKIASYSDKIKVSNAGHEVGGGRSEHALEVQLPFLQTALGKFHLVAMIMGDQDHSTCEELGNAMGKALQGRDDVLIVASSDLSHFHSSDSARKLDSVVMEDVRSFNYQQLSDDLDYRKAEACGGGPIIAAMIASQKLGANSVEITGYGDSGDITGDHSNVVGYLSAILYNSGEEKVYDLDASQNESKGENTRVQENPATGVDFGLSTADKKTLLKLARESIILAFEDQPPPYPAKISGALQENLGAFVTLDKNYMLRGCIGTFHADEPLYKIIARMARQAAFSDPRFPPVGKEEVKSLHIEISVLTPMKRIMDPETVVVGRDGLYMISGYRSGVLLPQVPVEYGWDRLKFLQQTCLKAGLNPDAWKDKATEIYTFQAEIFGEE